MNEGLSAPVASGGNYLLTTDGSGTGPVANPAEGAVGVVLRNPRGVAIATVSRRIGPATNTEAEYQALIAGLELAKEHGVRRLRVFIDSELLVDHLTDKAAVKTDHLRALHRRASDLLSAFSNCRLSWIPRAWNQEADLLATTALKAGELDTSADRDIEPPEDAPVVDAEGQAYWISEQTDIPVAVVSQVLDLEYEFMAALGIADDPDLEFSYYDPQELSDVGKVVDTQRLAQDAERFLEVRADVAALILDAETQFFRMRGLTSDD